MLVESGTQGVMSPNGLTTRYAWARFVTDDRVVIVAIELESNRGMSITNNAENVWLQLASVPERRGRALDGKSVALIEHYPSRFRGDDIDEPRFDLVTFEDPVVCRGPAWHPLAAAEVIGFGVDLRELEPCGRVS